MSDQQEKCAACADGEHCVDHPEQPVEPDIVEVGGLVQPGCVYCGEQKCDCVVYDAVVEPDPRSLVCHCGEFIRDCIPDARKVGWGGWVASFVASVRSCGFYGGVETQNSHGTSLPRGRSRVQL